MRFHSVQDTAFSDIPLKEVDVVIFCSGFESRCTHVPENTFDKLNPDASILILGFDDHNQLSSRKKSDQFYNGKYKTSQSLLSGDEYDGIFPLLNEKLKIKKKKNVSVLLDYTSMTRQWYAAILSWCKFQQQFEEVTLFTTYSVGKYIKKSEPMVIHEITSLPGFSGSTLARESSTLIFGLGFEGAASLCAIERLEPSVVYTFIANPAAYPEAYKRSIEVNEPIISHLAQANLEFSLFSVEDTFRGLSELLIAQPNNANITVVPMGPKPHILATLLLGLRYPQLTCIRVSGRGKKGENVKAEGRIVTTKIIFQ
ncbi:hypothetical protein [Mariprofundus ferrooxydans]|uniref:hypothetical protein n=1 Tax=Mariprofundus ferrooxydans TaxID=314344 RepID=UPI001430332E|nr:hypothetical protein [Mariprofundus ferrooxydans]